MAGPSCPAVLSCCALLAPLSVRFPMCRSGSVLGSLSDASRCQRKLAGEQVCL